MRLSDDKIWFLTLNGKDLPLNRGTLLVRRLKIETAACRNDKRTLFETCLNCQIHSFVVWIENRVPGYVFVQECLLKADFLSTVSLTYLKKIKMY